MTNHLNDFNSIIGQDEGKLEASTKDVLNEKGGDDLYEEMLVFFTGRTKSERSRKERSISFPLRVSTVYTFCYVRVLLIFQG